MWENDEFRMETEQERQARVGTKSDPLELVFDRYEGLVKPELQLVIKDSLMF